MMQSQQTHRIAGAIANDWTGDAAKVREHKLAQLAISGWSRRCGQKDFGDEFSFQQMHSTCVRGTFTGHRPGFGETVAVETFRAPELLQLRTQRLTARFTGQQKFLNIKRAGVRSRFPRCRRQSEQAARFSNNDVRLKTLNPTQLFIRFGRLAVKQQQPRRVAPSCKIQPPDEAPGGIVKKIRSRVVMPANS